jgi:hypothetical protein
MMKMENPNQQNKIKTEFILPIIFLSVALFLTYVISDKAADSTQKIIYLFLILSFSKSAELFRYIIYPKLVTENIEKYGGLSKSSKQTYAIAALSIGTVAIVAFYLV